MQLVKQNRHTQGSQAKWTSTSLLVPEQRKVVLLLHDSWGQNWEVRANRTSCSVLGWGCHTAKASCRTRWRYRHATLGIWSLQRVGPEQVTGRKQQKEQDTAVWRARRAGYTSEPVRVPALEAFCKETQGWVLMS